MQFVTILAGITSIGSMYEYYCILDTRGFGRSRFNPMKGTKWICSHIGLENTTAIASIIPFIAFIRGYSELPNAL